MPAADAAATGACFLKGPGTKLKLLQKLYNAISAAATLKTFHEERAMIPREGRDTLLRATASGAQKLCYIKVNNEGTKGIATRSKVATEGVVSDRPVHAVPPDSGHHSHGRSGLSDPTGSLVYMLWRHTLILMGIGVNWSNVDLDLD